MIHYVCSGGCLTIQKEAGLCLVSTCYRYRNPLSLCTCRDDQHGDWLFRNHPNPVKARAAAKRKLQKLSQEFKALVTPKSKKVETSKKPIKAKKN